MHEGHRGRLKNRFLKQDLDGFEPINALELLLFYAVPRRDTNELAHLLLERFGGISAVFDAPFEELVKVEGVGDNAATLLKLIPSLCRYYQVNGEAAEVYLTTTEKAGKYILPYFLGMNNEVVYLLALDAKNKLLKVTKIFEGTLTAAQMSIRKIVETAILHNAAKVILAHNHPGGIALPSREDLKTTLDVGKALSMLDIRLLDHVIVADNDFVSLADSGFFQAAGRYEIISRIPARRPRRAFCLPRDAKTRRKGKNMNTFKIESAYEPTGDQPQAIDRLTRGFGRGNGAGAPGVTGSARPLPLPT